MPVTRTRWMPSRRLLGGAALLLAWGVAVAVLPLWAPAAVSVPLAQSWPYAAALLGGLALADGLLARGLPVPRLERRLAGTVPVDVPVTVTLRVFHNAPRPATLTLVDHVPNTVAEIAPVLTVALRPQRYSSVRYSITPTERGRLVFPAIDCAQPSPLLGLWQRVSTATVVDETRVFPNFAAVAGYHLLSIDNHTSLLGIRKRVRRGEGLEFHQLREYRDGDTLRQIDWKASSRRRELISKEYQDERDQQVVFLLDSGRRMRARDGRLSHLDQAINAMVLLGYVALRQGDAVGLLAFGRDERWWAPRKHSASVNGLMSAVYDLQPDTGATDYRHAAETLVTRQHKRSLVVLMTNTRDETLDDLLAAVKLLRRKHLVLVANLRESALDVISDAPVDSFEDALACAGAAHYRHQRRRVHEQLHGLGVFTLDTTPDRLPAAVVNRYLDIKRSGYL